ncbi:hypothetical protein K504DRAFT_508481 [Pleomassaria siparia CBS 279.74]|uniref:Uncharacterized protein n=1 Tax=Pleomassaria siparia CBS 279.74 TaxID=1314801 RepID=A0A6G1JR44_9PLEO|nr:hypothetical protein K504DRAFT_508481 [Pleomassaria siparia CBS 279.74]
MHPGSQSLMKTYDTIKIQLKTLEDLSRKIGTYGKATAIFERLQKNMHGWLELPSTEFPQLDFDKHKSKFQLLSKDRPCKSFAREIHQVNAYETIFTVLRDHMRNDIEAPLEDLITDLKSRTEICCTRNPRFDIPLGGMADTVKEMKDRVYIFNSNSSPYQWMLGQEIKAMLRDLRYYECSGSFEHDTVEKARRHVRAAEWVSLNVGEAVEAMKHADL